MERYLVLEDGIMFKGKVFGTLEDSIGDEFLKLIENHRKVGVINA